MNDTHIAKPAPSLLKSSAVVSVLTLLSRVLGLVREIVVQHHFHDSAAADAFFVAFKIPNFLRRLFAEGAFSQAFIPVLSEYRTKYTQEEVKYFINSVSGTLTIYLGAMTTFIIAGMPVFIYVFAPGYAKDPVKLALTGTMLKITFPYLLLMALTAFASSILNSYRRFLIPALTPCLMNLVLIWATIYLTPYFNQPAIGLAWGVLIAGIAQWMFQLPFLAHLQLIPKPRFNPKHEGVIKIIKLMMPALFGVSVSQINLFVDNMVATYLPTGSVSWLWYSDRVTELPIGLVGIAIGTVILPSLSDLHNKQSPKMFSQTIDWGLRLVLLMGVPATLAIALIPLPMISTIYGMAPTAALKTADSLQAYSVGVLAFMFIKVLAPGYYARQDTKTPVRIGIMAVFVNLILIALLIGPLKHVGIALATSLASLFNAVMLFSGLIKRKVYVPESGWLLLLGKYAIANTIMAVVLYYLRGDDAQWFLLSTWNRVYQLALLCGAGMASYLVALYALRIRLKDFVHR